MPPGWNGSSASILPDRKQNCPERNQWSSPACTMPCGSSISNESTATSRGGDGAARQPAAAAGREHDLARRCRTSAGALSAWHSGVMRPVPGGATYFHHTYYEHLTRREPSAPIARDDGILRRHASRCSQRPDGGLGGMPEFRVRIWHWFPRWRAMRRTAGQARGALWGAIDSGDQRRSTTTQPTCRPADAATSRQLTTSGDAVLVPYKQEVPGSSPGPPITRRRSAAPFARGLRPMAATRSLRGV
jgi:hypothetical protein